MSVSSEDTPPLPVLVVAVPLTSADPRNITRQRVAIVQLADREAEIVAAVDTATRILQTAAALRSSVPDTSDNDWGVSELKARFSLTLGLEAGVLISKASAEASLEIEITLSKGNG